MRLPTHLEVSGLIRRTQAQGGFATVLARGESDAGTLLLVLREGGVSTVYERMPELDGSRRWAATRQEAPEAFGEFDAYLERRRAQDPDLWIVELDVRDGKRLIDEA